MSDIRVLIADDHDLVRAGVTLLLQAVGGVEVVGEAADGREAVAMAESLAPDVILMDIMMPELNGLDATARIVASNPRTRVVILSMRTGEEEVLTALRSGAVGYLVKNVKPDELGMALRAAARGEIYLCSAVSRHVVDKVLQRALVSDDTYDRLTGRQREVLQLVAEGRTSKEIARRLDVSVRTAESHRAQIMEALDIHDVAGLVRYAIRRGMIAP